MKFSFLIVTFLFLAACSKDRNSNTQSTTLGPGQASQPEQKDLKKLSLADALAEKYDSAIFTCDLWTRLHGPLFISDTPSDTASIDLLKDSTFPKKIQLRGSDENHSLSADIDLKSIELADTNLIDGDGNRYVMKNSPIIYGDYSGQSATNQVSSGSFGPNILQIYENVPEILDNASSGATGSVPAVDYVKCTLLTNAKSLYADQWQQTEKGDPKQCLLGSSTNTLECMVRQAAGSN